MSRIRVLIKDPGQKPREFNIENELHVFQRIVGGFVEDAKIGRGVIALCDEDGKSKAKEFNFWLPNGDCVVGTAIFCSTDGEDFASLSDEQMALFRGWCE